MIIIAISGATNTWNAHNLDMNICHKSLLQLAIDNIGRQKMNITSDASSTSRFN